MRRFEQTLLRHAKSTPVQSNTPGIVNILKHHKMKDGKKIMTTSNVSQEQVIQEVNKAVSISKPKEKSSEEGMSRVFLAVKPREEVIQQGISQAIRPKEEKPQAKFGRVFLVVKAQEGGTRIGTEVQRFVSNVKEKSAGGEMNKAFLSNKPKETNAVEKNIVKITKEAERSGGSGSVTESGNRDLIKRDAKRFFDLILKGRIIDQNRKLEDVHRRRGYNFL